MPGILPTLNMECVHQAVKTGLGLNAVLTSIRLSRAKLFLCRFAAGGIRLPSSNIRLSAKAKFLLIWKTAAPKDIGIERMHIEQDAGKSIHDLDPKKPLLI